MTCSINTCKHYDHLGNYRENDCLVGWKPLKRVLFHRRKISILPEPGSVRALFFLVRDLSRTIDHNVTETENILWPGLPSVSVLNR